MTKIFSTHCVLDQPFKRLRLALEWERCISHSVIACPELDDLRRYISLTMQVLMIEKITRCNANRFLMAKEGHSLNTDNVYNHAS